MQNTSYTLSQFGAPMNATQINSSGILGSIGNLVDRIGDSVEQLVQPVGGSVDNVLDAIGDLLRDTDAADGGLLGNLLENGMLGSGSGTMDPILRIDVLGSAGVLTLDIANTRVAVLPDDGSIVTIDSANQMGGRGEILDLGGVLGNDGLINLTGLVGDEGLLDLNSILGSVLGLLGQGAGPQPGDYTDGSGNIDPAKFEAAKFGTAGNDSFLVDAQTSTYVDGRAGLDVVNFASASTGFSFAAGKDAVALQNATDFFYFDNVERVKFFDAQLYLDTGAGENAGAGYRLYQAAFNRTPDNDGLKYWIGRLDAGSKLDAVADGFVFSAEFRSTYGSPETVSNANYIDLLYTNTLGRGYDAGGFSYWVNKLDSGQNDRGDLLAFFSESNENVTRVAAKIDDGILLA